ncbi:hypothetical protein GCM10009753_04480 [Streptantibioticus ferralitis]
MGLLVILELAWFVDEMALTPDQRTVEELTAAGCDPAFDHRVRPRVSDAGEHGLDPGVGEDRVAGLWLLPVLTVDQEPRPASGVF